MSTGVLGFGKKMTSERGTCVAHTATRFGNYLYVKGYVHVRNAKVVQIEVVGAQFVGQRNLVGLPSPGYLLGEDLGFEVNGLLVDRDFPYGATVEFICDTGYRHTETLQALTDRFLGNQLNLASSGFAEAIAKAGTGKILDVGGRARSGVDRSKQFPNFEVTVLDIVEGENVDVVGDAHEMSRLFPADHFDFVMSVSVFEHILMPWKVAIEINKVLKPGGLVMIHTHQTIGMHDLPWDFWRFSSDCWPALFGPPTGFEILHASMNDPSFLFPLFWRQGKEGLEGSAGFEGATVLARKTGTPRVSWEVSVAELTSTRYPKS